MAWLSRPWALSSPPIGSGYIELHVDTDPYKEILRRPGDWPSVRGKDSPGEIRHIKGVSLACHWRASGARWLGQSFYRPKHAPNARGTVSTPWNWKPTIERLAA